MVIITGHDKIIRGITKDGMIKFAAASCRGMVGRAMEIHKLTPVTAAALGRTLIAASILGNDLKEEGNSLTIQIKGNGPIGNIVVVSDHLGNTRGYCQRPHIELPLRSDGKLDVSGAVGTEGYLNVIKDYGLKDPYVGQVELRSGEIAEDITAYLAESEQIPSACALGVLVDKDYSIRCAGGYIIQLMPNVDDGTVSRLESALETVKPVTQMLDSGLSTEDMMRKVLTGFDIQFLEDDPVEYRCFCSRKRVERTLLSLGEKELNKLYEDGEGAEITCQFCDEIYRFSGNEIGEMLKTITR